MKGKKTIFRPVEQDDMGFCQKLFNDSYLRDLVVGWSLPLSMNAQKTWFLSLENKNDTVRFIIETLDGTSIGLTGLWDIDWHNRTALTAIKLKSEGISGQGFGRDAVMAMNAFAFFDVGLHRLWGTIIDYNIPSYNVYVKKCGWKVEGTLRDHIYRNGSYHNLYYVACLKEDFMELTDAKDYIRPQIPKGMRKFQL